MNISLTPQLQAMVEQKVASGLYNSASEVIREALRLLEEQDRLREMRLQDLRREINLGLEDIKQGRTVTVNEKTLKDLIQGIEADGQKMLTRKKVKKAA